VFIRLHVRLSRRLSRPCHRRLNRRRGGRHPNYLAQAFSAFGRAIRAHRKLIKLDPERFDRAVREGLARDRQAEGYGAPLAEVEKIMHRWKMNQWGKNRAKTGQELRKEKMVERLMCEWESWLMLGREAFERHEMLTPHRWLGLGTIARLLDLSSVLGRLSLGQA
jgi:hypothetical protein